MKKIAILQSNYIPCKGYFDMIAAVDEFILYGDIYYTGRDWDDHPMDHLHQLVFNCGKDSSNYMRKTH